MNVKMTMVVVVRFAPTLKEALNVLVERAICYMMMEGNVEVQKQSTCICNTLRVSSRHMQYIILFYLCMHHTDIVCVIL